MPADFDRCARRGGKIRNIKPRPDIIIPVCYPKGGGSPVHGDVHHLDKQGHKTN